MEYRGFLFTKIEFRDFDIVVPFVCTCCGWCCEHYLPRFTEREVLRIAGDAHLQCDDTLRQYLEGYEKKRHGRDVSCIFLLGNGLCGIHDHPLRPEVCRLYPFSFRDGDERCPPFREPSPDRRGPHRECRSPGALRFELLSRDRAAARSRRNLA